MSAASAKWDDEVDVLVVGSGAAGCAAAIAAARTNPAGKVVLCEAAPKMVGGTTKIAGGGWLWCPGNPYLKAMGVHQTSEEVLALIKELAYPKDEGVAPPAEDVELLQAFAEEWPDVVKTIIDEKIMKLQVVTVREPEDGVRVRALLEMKRKQNPHLEKEVGISAANVEQLAGLMPSYCGTHPLDKCPSGKVLAPDGGTTSSQLEKSAKARKVEFRMGWRVVDVVLASNSSNNNKEVVGAVVEVSAPEGKKTVRVRARGGVIFGSGGFARNQKLMEQHFGGKSLAPKGSCAAKTNVGDLVSIAAKHNVPVSGMDFAWFKQCVLPYRFPQRLGVFFLNGDSYMVVDRTGRRFSSDREFYQQRGRAMVGRPDRRCVFFVFDERSWKNCEGPIKGLGSAYPMLEGDEDAMVRGKNAYEIEAGLREKLRQVAPDFELAADFGASLEAQIARFNADAVRGVDSEFGRGDDVSQYCWSVPRAGDNKYPNKTMYPLDTTKLCAVVMGLSVLDTKGGPVINKAGQVIGADKKPVAGWYGCGNAVRSPTRHSYPASGTTLSLAIMFGWKAGVHAAQRAGAAAAAAPKAKM